MHFVANNKIEHAQTNMLELTTLEQYCNMLFTVSNPQSLFLTAIKLFYYKQHICCHSNNVICSMRSDILRNKSFTPEEMVLWFPCLCTFGWTDKLFTCISDLVAHCVSLRYPYAWKCVISVRIHTGYSYIYSQKKQAQEI